MAEAIPDGFSPAGLGAGFEGRCEPVWLDQERGPIWVNVGPNHANPLAADHGSTTVAFTDAQLIAISAGRGEGKPHIPTSSLSIDYLAPATIGDWVKPEVQPIRQTRALVFVQSVMRVGDKPLARMSAIYRKN